MAGKVRLPMKLSLEKFTSRIVPAQSDRQFAETPGNAGPGKPLADFIAGVRARYHEKKQKDSPNDKKIRLAPIWYFLASMAIVVLMQHFFVGAHIEVISYSQFKTLVKKDLVNDLVIHETVIAGNLKGAALKLILAPDKLKQITPEALAGKTLVPFETVRVADPGLTAELETANVPFKGEVSSNWLSNLLSWIVPAA